MRDSLLGPSFFDFAALYRRHDVEMVRRWPDIDQRSHTAKQWAIIGCPSVDEKKIRAQNFDRNFPEISLPHVPPGPGSNAPECRRASIKSGPDRPSAAPGPTNGHGKSSEKTFPPNQSREQVKMAAV